MNINWVSIIVLLSVAAVLGVFTATVYPESTLLPALVGGTYGVLHNSFYPMFK